MKKCIKNKETRRFSIFNLQSSICLLIFSMLSLNIMAQDIYVGGQLNNRATVWKNGVPTVLTIGEICGIVNSVVVDNGIVYAAGIDSGAKLWIDGAEAYAFGDYTYAYSVVVSDDDVYVAGCVATGAGIQGKVWKNGIAEPGYTEASCVNALFISNGNVYAAGEILDGNVWKSGVWENGNLLYPSIPGPYKAIVVDDNGDVYTAGYRMEGYRYIPGVFKNNEDLYISETGIGTDYHYQLGLYISSGGAIYVAGNEMQEAGSWWDAKLWIDGELTSLNINGLNQSFAHSVFVYDDVVYLAGQGDNYTKAILWIDGEPTILANGGACQAHSVFVAPPDTLLTITVLADPLLCGTVTGGGIYSYGDQVTIAAISTDCCTFVHWREGDNLISTDAVYTFAADESRILTAHFELVTHEIILLANPPEGGVVEGGGIYPCVETVTVEAFPNEGFEFVNWTVGGFEISTENPYTFVVIEDSILVANFEMSSAMPPIIITESLPDGTIGVSYSATFEADSDTPVTWSIESGSLPENLSLDSITGIIDGLPIEVETFEFTIKATNASGSDIKVLTIVIHLVPTILITSLPDGATDTPYFATLEAESSTPITWSIGRSGSLPTGLSLSATTGVIDGTPTETGIFDFTIQANNTAGGSASKELSITVEFGVGIGETWHATSVQVFPNPTGGELMIEMGDMGYETCDITICDVYGRKHQVSNLKSQASSLKIDISHLPAGVYFLKIHTEAGEVMRKVVKR
jgi:hypothetical protein